METNQEGMKALMDTNLGKMSVCLRVTIPDTLSLGIMWLYMKVTTHLHLVLRLRMHRPLPLLPPNVFMTWCLSTEQFYLDIYATILH
jgi:hypothetical protein